MLGDKIKDLRKSMNLTQEQLCQKIGIAQSTLGMIESNKREAGKKTLLKLADFFGVTVDFLLSNKIIDTNINIDTIFSGSGTLVSSTENNKLSKEEVKLLENYNKSNNEGKKMIISYSDYVSKNHVSVETEISASIDNSMPIAAHANEKATEEDIKHDMDIMNDDSQW
ncbi:helix-turn-helix domain-containing protein [Clostridium butyricum]|jgi:transcriptional regulator with XRE-family HTH domain|uniref:Helix-turn-helix domain-containing protein n=1 Tax=Clostridium butyricum TaxID=1492 RepID=A0A6L9EN33_CLOBU|nr:MULTISPECIES: helix-turn-helix transcriptional regulator [Clostridium]AXB84555.1 transcriptional regulator [Clostridium butyricum]MDU1602479.1 helix-turn-helix transcriptional regulator [Clostridium sp.]MDU4587001.1 helix-turn-helix transcriptional regulator [Clostridium sp.]NAS18087.1 helix-turn-helix domain-containing protein [Clostridium butyricum]